MSKRFEQLVERAYKGGDPVANLLVRVREFGTCTLREARVTVSEYSVDATTRELRDAAVEVEFAGSPPQRGRFEGPMGSFADGNDFLLEGEEAVE